MPSRQPPEPQMVDAHSAEHIYILRRLNGRDPLLSVTPPLILEIQNGIYKLKLAKTISPNEAGYQGEYDPAKSYSAGQTFKISAANPFLSGLTVKAGFYAVRSAIVSDPLGYGPFAGSLPANPIATGGIDSTLAFFDPDNNGAPTLGAAPNDRIYAEIINEFC
jgi:hypothetical protein